MPKYKICVYTICRNEEKFVDRWMDSMSEADMVIVTDTGSEDETVKKLRERGAVVYEEKVDPWRFDTARNIAMDHVPDDADICVSADLDEIFDPGWRDKLEKAWQPEHTRASYWFSWAPETEGIPNRFFSMEKIHRRRDFRWIHPVHEILEYSGDDPDNTVYIDDIFLRHYPDTDKSRYQYLPLLELSSRENPQDDRTMFWLGREYAFAGLNDKAIDTLEKHLKLENAVWDEERSASMRYIALIHKADKNYDQAKSWLFRAVAECRRAREPWFELAALGYKQNDWPLTFYAVHSALAITQSTNSYLVEPKAWGYHLYDLGAIACYHLDMYEKALEYADEACSVYPDNKRLIRNRELIAAKLSQDPK